MSSGTFTSEDQALSELHRLEHSDNQRAQSWEASHQAQGVQDSQQPRDPHDYHDSAKYTGSRWCHSCQLPEKEDGWQHPLVEHTSNHNSKKLAGPTTNFA